MKKGFTLIELLAVIVILTIIALIAVPVILGVIDKAKKGATTSSALGYVDAVEKASVLLTLKNETLSGNYTIDTLKDSLQIKGTKPTKGNISVSSNGEVISATLCINNYKVIYNDNKAIIIANNCDDLTEAIYKDSILNGTDPVLGIGMIPVTIANDGKVTYASPYSKWYDYSNKVWANAVKLVNGSIYNVGDTIPESAIESYFVWVPRYKYKIFNIGNYNGLISAKPTTSNKQTIDIVFESKSIDISNGNTLDSYLTHPAFTTLDTNGIWVGKFETGFKGATTTSEAEVILADSTKPIIKPNVYSWRNNKIYNTFLSSYYYDRNNDSHMMKNTEWGAVAYLSHSVYGINKEVNVNNNSSFKTGYSALPTTNQNKYLGEYGDSLSYNSPYNTMVGYLASTTGNISGIYDMSGCSEEYMASYMSGWLKDSGFTSTNISFYNTKYFDVYSSSSSVYSFNYRILGDATSEIGPFYQYTDEDSNSRYHNSWYSDYSIFIDRYFPWFARGGSYNYGPLAGLFGFARYTGIGITSFGSRIVLS